MPQARPRSRTGNRSVVFAGAPFTFPEPLGERTLRMENRDLSWLEVELEPELDKLNRRILDGVGPIDDHTGEPLEFPFDSVWDALGEISSRRIRTTSELLLVASLRHTFDGTPDAQRAQAIAAVGDLPPALLVDDELTDALSRVIAAAHGHDLDAFGTDEDDVPPPPAPPAGDGGASGSDGTSSSPSGPPPPSSVD